ncbi:hypothetical protein LEP1GSC041_1116 [Leptospira noguchii str. 2006001870]|nr:hypothetical protein LEP1GSC041_1116 [Leptospira noguchii str. 2006001870]
MRVPTFQSSTVNYRFVGVPTFLRNSISESFEVTQQTPSMGRCLSFGMAGL